MQFITGRIVIIGDKKVISKDDGSFSSVVLIIKKKMKKKLRNIAFKCYGRLADEVVKLRINDRVEIEFLLDSKQSKNPQYADYWNTDLQAVSVDRVEKLKNENNTQINFVEND